MPNEQFNINLDLYKRGLYELICFYDKYQNFVFKLHDKQIEAIRAWHDDETTSIGYGGSARGGKSALISFLVIMDCYAYPGTRYLMGRRDLKQFWGTTYKTLFRMMENFGLEEGRDYHNNQNKNEITFLDPESEITIRNLELKPRDTDATEFGSLEITKALIDQSENIELKIIEKITERVGSFGVERHDVKGKVIECFNPLKTHVHRRFWIPYKQDDFPKEIKFIRALPKDNPSPEAQRWVEEKTADYRAGIMPKVEYEKQILGNFDYADSDNALIEYEAILDYFNNQAVKGTGEYFLTIDVARKGKDKTVFRVWNGFVCVMRLEMRKSLISEVIEKARKLQEKFGIVNSKTVADEDGVGGGVVDGLGCMGFVNNSRPINAENYRNLKAQAAYLLAEKFKKREISEICNMQSIKGIVSEELEQLKIKDLNKDGKLDIVPKQEIVRNIGRSPDDLDSIIMRMFFELHEPLWFA